MDIIIIFLMTYTIISPLLNNRLGNDITNHIFRFILNYKCRYNRRKIDDINKSIKYIKDAKNEELINLRKQVFLWELKGLIGCRKGGYIIAIKLKDIIYNTNHKHPYRTSEIQINKMVMIKELQEKYNINNIINSDYIVNINMDYNFIEEIKREIKLWKV